jgi:CarD family transcriptional regulator
VLKSLTFLAKSKSLSFREKRMLDRARFLVVSEISEVSRQTSETVEGQVTQALERCFMVKARAAQRAAAARTAAPATRKAPVKATTVAPRAVAASAPGRRAVRAS